MIWLTINSVYPKYFACYTSGHRCMYLGFRYKSNIGFMVRVINLSVLLAKSQVIPSQTILVQCGILGLSSQSYAFSSSHVQMWELDHKKGWVLKNWCFQIVVLEDTLESLLDCKEIKPGNQSWIFIGMTDAEAETPILWPPDVESWFI